MFELGIIIEHTFDSFGQKAAFFTLHGAIVPLVRNKFGVCQYWLNSETVYMQCVGDELQFVEFEPGTELIIPRGVWHGFIFEEEECNAEFASLCDSSGEPTAPFEFARTLPDFTKKCLVECERKTIEGEPVLSSRLLGILGQDEVMQINIGDFEEGERVYLGCPCEWAEELVIANIEVESA